MTILLQTYDRRVMEAIMPFWCENTHSAGDKAEFLTSLINPFGKS